MARKSRLTKLAFNARHPVLLVGTEHGGVSCFKLSPNLRRGYTPGEAPGGIDAEEARINAVHSAGVTDHALTTSPVAGAADGGLSRTDSQRAAARAAEAARLDGVLAQAAKCNAAMRDDDFVLM